MVYPLCVKCESNYVYEDQGNLVCPECGFEWNPEEISEQNAFVVKDSNGVILELGDKIALIKDLKVKGSSQSLKIGTKTVIRGIVEGKDHELDCKFPGVGQIMVTAKFVKKL